MTAFSPFSDFAELSARYYDDCRREDRVQKFMWEFNHWMASQPRATPKRGRRM
jgi:hypothetical protein